MYIGRILEHRHIPMSEFDQMAVVKVARAHLETIKEPRRRQVLENFIEHAEAEMSGDYEALMASCSKKSQVYANYGSDFGAPQSYEELEVHYRNLIASNVYLLHFEVEKLAVDDDVVFIEGLVHQLYPGSLIEPIFGIAVDDPEAVHQLTSRTALTFVFDEEGKGCGEHSYSSGPKSKEEFLALAAEEVPETFFHNPLTA